ncbi:MAG TPA: maleylpyruvate isomerase family mycothiol-dependent enzyme [Streptosporangiaceae bacterium]|jgi:maleylpyruvate isomerase|nr:maleylpyruvate isomerase family mycothiol-dependent enzyme [Streptosporangiaceae bacterium]
MDTSQRDLSEALDEATQRVIDEVRLLSDSDVRAASLLPGWSRAHVLAHLARNADAMRNLLAGAQAGQDRLAYPSAEAREAAINEGAAADARKLVDDLAASAMSLRTVARQLPAEAWDYPVAMLNSPRFPASQLLARRLAEVELHHCDLGIGYGPGQWLAVFSAMELDEPLRALREERAGYVQPESVRARSMAKDIPPYRSGHPLPGSWLGRRRT